MEGKTSLPKKCWFCGLTSFLIELMIEARSPAAQSWVIIKVRNTLRDLTNASAVIEGL